VSLNTLTTLEVRRTALAKSGGAAGSALRSAVAGGDGVTNALTALVGYIPTEVVTLYVSALSAEQALVDATGFFNATWIFWSFAALTPVLLLLVYASKLATAGEPLPRPPQWPWWKMTAATIAFAVWATAVPGNPYLSGTASAVAGLGAMLVSTLLSLLTPIVEGPPA